MTVWIFLGLLCSILSLSIYHFPQLDIQVKSYSRLNLPKASFIKFVRLDTLQAQSDIWVKSYGCLNLIYYRPQSNIRVKSYDRLNFLGTSLFNFESLDILWPSIKHSCQKLSSLNLFVASLFNFECLDILWVLIGHPSQKLSPSQFSRSFHFQFQTSQYIMGLCWTSQKIVMAV